MTKLIVFLGGVATGFALSSSMTDEQRRRVIGRVRGTTHSPTVERLAGAAHTVTGAAADALVTRVEHAADAVAGAIDGNGDGTEAPAPQQQ